MVLVDRALWIGLKCSLTAPAHLLVESAQCGHVACRIRGLPLRSWRRNSHRRGPWPVGWKDRKAQQKVARLIWPRCPCIPAIDRRQFFGGGHLRKLRSIIRSPKESLGAVSDCAVPDGRRVGGKGRYRRLDTRLNLANNATFWRCSACHGWCQCASILVQTATGRENLEAYGNSIPIIHSVFHNSVEN